MANPLITSRQNPRVKAAAKLRSARERRRQGRILIDGVREILYAIDSGAKPLEAFYCEELCHLPDCGVALLALESQGAELFRVTPPVYAKLQFGDRDDGMVVVAEAPQQTLATLKLPAAPLVAVLEGIEKPGNLGAILRTADAAGVDAVIVADGRTDLFNPNTIRASLGTVFRDNVCEATTADTLAWLRQQGLRIIAARPDAAVDYTSADLRGGVAIVLGSEAEGLTKAWNITGAIPVQLPMSGISDSLNVSTTAAVLFYEARRQRGSR
jgi:RNA methyltransferase, TrmH family